MSIYDSSISLTQMEPQKYSLVKSVDHTTVFDQIDETFGCASFQKN